jgi:hypothetical protein
MASRTVLTRNGLGVDSFKPGEPIKTTASRRATTRPVARSVSRTRDRRVLKSTEFAPTLDGRGRAGQKSIVGTGDEAFRRLELSRPADGGGRTRARRSTP